MKIQRGSVILRDYLESDIEDDVRWMSTETAWIQADTPWEEFEPVDLEKLRADLQSMVGRYSPNAMRSRMEIEADGIHIGFVSTYPLTADWSTMDFGSTFADAPLIRALGIEICEPDFWHRGLGTQALAAWVEYLRGFGWDELYLETWSGNTAMMKSAQKLGFTVCHCVPGLREVNGRRYDALVYRMKMK